MNTAFFYGFRISFRRLLKDKKYTLLNVTGLALSMAAALLIFLYLNFETSFDRHHPDHEIIYRVGTDITLAGERQRVALNSVPIGPAIVEQVPEFTSFVRIFPANFYFRNLVYRYNDKSFQENTVFATDSTFFDFFHFDFLEGNSKNALTEPFSLVITQSMSERYFGDEKALGRSIEVEGAGNFIVTAVISNPLPNSHLQFEGFFSISTMPHLDHLFATGFQPGVTWDVMENNHTSRLVWVYVKTTDGYDPENFIRDKWEDFYETNIGDISFFDDIKPIFQPLADIHLSSKLGYEMTNETGSVTMMSQELVKIFFITGIFLILLASINYTNISISRFQNRGKEIGIKKVVGAHKRDLVTQFLSESVITSLFAFLLALFILEISLPAINDLMGTPLSLSISEDSGLLLLYLVIAFFTGILSGAYPAVYFSRIQPLKVLHIRFTAGRGSLGLKKLLIIIQFVISVFMIISTMVVVQQLRFINKKDLGFDRENIVVVELKDNYSRRSANVLKNKLLQEPFFENAALSNYFPSRLSYSNNVEIVREDDIFSISVNIVQVDADYPEFMKMELAEGRFFDPEEPSDYHNAVLINQEAQRLFGLDNPIGKTLRTEFTWPDGTVTGERTVVGVIKNFHYTTLNRPVEPILVYPMANQANYLNLKIRGNYTSEAIKTLEKEWQNFRPGYPLIYSFLDQIIDQMYISQQILSMFFASFALLCIIIAFLGLYGISAYSIEQRTREIGIRKVLGADINEIIYLLGREFFILIIIAGILASLLAVYFLSEWLQGFAYHTQLTPLPFITGIASAFIVAIFAVLIHAWKAARLNPVDLIKYE